MKQIEKHRIKMPRNNVIIPKGFEASADDTIAYVAEFDRLNCRKPVAYLFRGKKIGGVK